MKKKFLYNFGMSQDDARTERKALELEPGDRLICLASAGEVPLNLLATSDVQIDAVDISLPQIRLARLKLAAALHLEPREAVRFIGYRKSSAEERMRFFQQLSRHLETSDKTFWEQNPVVFEKGPVHAARFERYISRLSWIGLAILNRRKITRLFEFDDVAAQRQYFDRNIHYRKLKWIFSVAFHPKIYKNRGMDTAALRHSNESDMASFFFNRFRNFCTATLARENYFFQFTFFNRILFDEALPDYLKEEGNRLLRKRANRLAFYNESITSRIKKSPEGRYNKFALSNVGDWLSQEEYIDLLQTIGQRAAKPGRALLRYIHFAYAIPGDLADTLRIDQSLGAQLEVSDRYPFYSLVPMRILG